MAVKPGNWFGHVLCVHQILSMYVQSPLFGECSSRAASASLKKSGDGFWDMKYLLNPIETQKSKVQSFWPTSPPEGILHRSAQFAFPFSMKTPNRNGSKHVKTWKIPFFVWGRHPYVLLLCSFKVKIPRMNCSHPASPWQEVLAWFNVPMVGMG